MLWFHLRRFRADGIFLWIAPLRTKPSKSKTSNVLALSFDCTELLLRLYWDAEPSSFFKRALAWLTPSPRLNDNERSVTSYIQRSISVNPFMRFRQPPKALHQKHSFVAMSTFHRLLDPFVAIHRKSFLPLFFSILVPHQMPIYYFMASNTY